MVLSYQKGCNVLKKVDSEGRVILHGRRYVYETPPILYHKIEGVVLWDRRNLMYVFMPDDLKSYSVTVIQFHYSKTVQGGRIALVASELRRVKK